MCETCISRLVPPWVGPDIGVTVKDRPSACVLVEEAEATAGAAVLIGRARWASIWLASIWRKGSSRRALQALAPLYERAERKPRGGHICGRGGNP